MRCAAQGTGHKQYTGTKKQLETAYSLILNVHLGL